MNFTIRPAELGDLDAMCELLPRLGNFELIPNRDSADLWKDDAKLLKAHLRGQADQCFAQVAVQDDTVVGLTLVTMQPEFMSHKPSGHLESICVAASAEGSGVGKALLDAAETEATTRGALAMTLHVYHSNRRAAGIYERRGYHSEIERCTKWLGE
jgi:ribosomal protein S18 acetylase RimI-like enzyme